MKKITVLLLALMMVFGFTACGGSKTDDQVTKVGFIYIGSATDGGFTQAHDEARQKVEAHFDGKVKTYFLENVKEDKESVKTAALNLMDQGCTIIVGNSFGFMDGMADLATKYPDVYFLHFSGYKANDTNFDNFFGAMEQPRYLSGIAAGMMTKTDKLGYVAAFPYTEVNIGINAFTLGAQSVNPNVEVKVVYINTWYDPAKEKQAAEALLAQGCDIIAQHCDTTGPLLAAQNAGKLSIGYNSDKGKDFPDTFITAPIWHHEAYYIPTIQAIMDGTFKPSSYYGTMADGYVDLAPFTAIVPQNVQDKVNAVKAKIISGEFSPLSGKIEFTDGTLWCKAGQTLTRAEIWPSTLKLVKGVTSSGQ